MSNNDFRIGPSGRHVVPGWATKKHRDVVNDTHYTGTAPPIVYVGAAALLGVDGFGVMLGEEAVELDPKTYGLLMLQGYSFIAGRILAKSMTTLHVNLGAPGSPVADLRGEELVNAVRTYADEWLRRLLSEMFQYGGQTYQATVAEKQGKPDIRMAGISQALGLWMKVFESPIQFNAPPGPETDRRTDGPDLHLAGDE